MLTDTKAFSGFAVDDIGAAKRFYGDTLGVKTTMLDEENGLMVLHLAGGLGHVRLRQAGLHARDLRPSTRSPGGRAGRGRAHRPRR